MGDIDFLKSRSKYGSQSALINIKDESSDGYTYTWIPPLTNCTAHITFRFMMGNLNLCFLIFHLRILTGFDFSRRSYWATSHRHRQLFMMEAVGSHYRLSQNE